MYSIHTSCHLDSVVNVWAEREEKQVRTFIVTVIVSTYTSGFLVKSTSSLHFAILQVSDFIIVCNYKSPDVIKFSKISFKRFRLVCLHIKHINYSLDFKANSRLQWLRYMDVTIRGIWRKTRLCSLNVCWLSEKNLFSRAQPHVHSLFCFCFCPLFWAPDSCLGCYTPTWQTHTIMHELLNSRRPLSAAKRKGKM